MYMAAKKTMRRCRPCAVRLVSTVLVVVQILGMMLESVHGLLSGTFIGIDLGTSGARVSVIQDQGHSYEEMYSRSVPWSDFGDGITASTASPTSGYDDPDVWMAAVHDLLLHAAAAAAAATSGRGSSCSVRAVCVSGTSASCLLVDDATSSSSSSSSIMAPTRHPRMYNYNVVNDDALRQLREFVPDKHTARSPTGSLAKLLAWHAEQPLTAHERLCHQADYVIRHLCDTEDEDSVLVSDWHNCLKLGYDVRTLEWPAWMKDLFESAGLNGEQVLPSKVVSPGVPIGTIKAEVADRLGLSRDVVLVGGTTDSNAAFFAATRGAAAPGTAVTSLGSTLAIKQLSASYVEDADKGVYSHRCPSVFGHRDDTDEAWLVGGASNVGCAVLRQLDFSNEELVDVIIHWGTGQKTMN
jgi:sugar (pentulose or hexulose) kinase